jgi:histidinol phosphatase-like enzyme (inositol monophosphatase family)
MLAPACPSGAVDAAQRAADAAAEVVRQWFRAGIGVESKADASPVTVADRESERAIRAVIETAFPEHGIVGEEHGSKNADAEWVWHIDPIDGTGAFITGSPLFGILIGLAHRGRPVLGLLDAVAMRERWLAWDGHATTLNGVAARKRRGEVPLAEAALGTTSTSYYKAECLAGFERLRKATGRTRYGGDCYIFGLVACGFLDVAVESNVNSYDIAACVPVVENAGGRMTDWAGHRLDLSRGGKYDVLAVADPALLAPAVAALQG